MTEVLEIKRRNRFEVFFSNDTLDSDYFKKLTLHTHKVEVNSNGDLLFHIWDTLDNETSKLLTELIDSKEVSAKVMTYKPDFGLDIFRGYSTHRFDILPPDLDWNSNGLMSLILRFKQQY